MTENIGTLTEDASSRAERRKRDPIGQILDFLSNNSSNSNSTEPAVSTSQTSVSPVQSIKEITKPKENQDELKEHTRKYSKTNTVSSKRKEENVPLDDGSAFKPFSKPNTCIQSYMCQNGIAGHSQRDFSLFNTYATHMYAAQNICFPVNSTSFFGQQYPVQCPTLPVAHQLMTKLHTGQVFPQSYGYPTPYDGNLSGIPWTEKKVTAGSSFNPACILVSEGTDHHVTHTPPRYQCDSCKKSYSTYGGLSKHKQFHCVNQVKKEFSCKFCGKSYGSLGALKMHIRTHTLPCKCKICGKAFSRPWLLQGHVRTHTGEKPFRCEHCSRAFADRSNLRAHLQTHSEVKKYGCKHCNKTFSRMSLLVKHKENHCYST